MRADARRNRDAVLDAGAELLAARPGATMQEIADASGLGRATVYRHFPAREDLVDALVARVGEDIAEVLGRALGDPAPADGAAAVDGAAGGGDAAAALRRLATAAVTLGRRWAFLGAITDPSETTPAVIAGVERDYLAWVAAAQARGELVDADPAFVSAATRGLIDAGVQSIEDPDAAAAAVGDALVRAFVVAR